MHSSIILSLLLTSLTTSLCSAQKITAAETDVGAILKSMDQSKLSGIPPTLRAVFVKMPENPEKVTPADRAAVKACVTDPAMDQLAKEACSAQDDQLSAVLDKKKVTATNMAIFARDAIMAGAKMPQPAAN